MQTSRINERLLLAKAPQDPKTRFAPSPTGFMHLGHVLSLLYVYCVTKILGAKFFLRIENRDQERMDKIYEEAIIKDISWLGIIPCGVEYQSENKKSYDATQNFLAQNNLLYFCACSRKDIAKKNPQKLFELRYPGSCRDLNLKDSENFGIRAKFDNTTLDFDDLLCGRQKQNPLNQCGDLLVRDRRGNHTYNFAAAVDDLNGGTNIIVRGQDLIHCTGRQLLLQKMLQNEQKILFLHHPLILDSGGSKLAKSLGAQSIRDLKNLGHSKENIFAMALRLINLTTHQSSLSLNDVMKFLVA